MKLLNLPSIDISIKKIDGKDYIFDIIRKNWVKLTPEEWVRQHVIHFLIREKHCPASLMQIEKGLKQHVGNKRTDIVVYDKNANPLIIVECKSYTVAITQTAIDQAAHYNINLNAPYLLVSNGINHYGFFIDFKNSHISPLQTIPEYGELNLYGMQDI